MTLGGPAPSVGGFRRLAKGGTAPAAADAPGACQQEPPGPPESWGPDPEHLGRSGPVPPRLQAPRRVQWAGERGAS